MRCADDRRVLSRLRSANGRDIESAIAAMAGEPDSGIVILPARYFPVHSRQISQCRAARSSRRLFPVRPVGQRNGGLNVVQIVEVAVTSSGARRAMWKKNWHSKGGLLRPRCRCSNRRDRNSSQPEDRAGAWALTWPQICSRAPTLVIE